MLTPDQVGRWMRTVRHLDPSQAAHRVRLRAQRAAVVRYPEVATRVLLRPAPETASWPRDWRPLDSHLSWPTAAELYDGQVTLLGLTRPLATEADWRPADAPQLWRYHLQYWDWIWGLAGTGDPAGAREHFARLWQTWSASARFGRYDEWSPYVASVRAWTLCGVYAELVRGGPVEEQVRESLGLHAGFLLAHLERDVGGNHLLKNVKALVGLGVFLHDAALTRRATAVLATEVARQVLQDGGHYERAPAYHCQVLGDLVDVDGLLTAAGAPVPGVLSAALPRMRAWLAELLLPDGTVPMLNDGFPVDPALVARLLAGTERSADRLVVLRDSGYVVAQAGRLHLLADVGLPCPDELPAHAHADTLSFLLYDEDQPVVADTGTSTYDGGARRQLERSTRAHSTVEVDGADSTEVYGAFRAGRRARVTLERAAGDDTVVVAASHDGYRHLVGAPLHRRRWTLNADRLRVEDTVSGTGAHSVVSRVIVAPGVPVQPDRVGALRFTADAEPRMVDWSVAAGWQARRPACALVREVRADLPLTMWMEFAT